MNTVKMMLGTSASSPTLYVFTGTTTNLQDSTILPLPGVTSTSQDRATAKSPVCSGGGEARRSGLARTLPTVTGCADQAA